MKRVKTAKEEGTSPECAKREHPHRPVDTPMDHAQSRTGEKQSGQYVERDNSPRDSDKEFKLFQISHQKPEPSIIIPVKVNGEDCSMELDTGASVSIMSEEAWKKSFAWVPLEKSQIKLRTYTGETLDVIGQAQVEVTSQNQTANLPIQIVKGQGPSLFGRNWLRDIKLNWGSIKKISSDLDNVLTQHQSVFMMIRHDARR